MEIVGQEVQEGEGRRHTGYSGRHAGDDQRGIAVGDQSIRAAGSGFQNVRAAAGVGLILVVIHQSPNKGPGEDDGIG